MAVATVEGPKPAIGFERWPCDLHEPEVVLWFGRTRVVGVLKGLEAGTTAVFAVDEGRQLESIPDGAPLAVAFRVDHTRVRKREVVPVRASGYLLDPGRGRIEAEFGRDAASGRSYRLPASIPASLESPVLFARRLRVGISDLAPYGGDFVAEDPGCCLVPGMTVQLETWLPWAGPLRLHAQLTARRDEGGAARVAFRMTDRESVETAAIVLAGTVPSFGFEALKTAGVSPRRMTRFLTVRTVADDPGFRRALELRLASNRSFGRLAEVRDPMTVADPLDRHSINFVCLLGDKTVGTGRVVVNAGSRALSEIEAETQGLPSWVWSGGFVEVSRFAIHPDYAGSGISVALFREVARLAFNLRCRYLVLDAIEKLVPAYEQIGAKRLPLTKAHPYSDERVQVMVIDVGRSLTRFDRRLLYWQYVFGPVLKHHASTSSSRTLTRFARGAGNLPFWSKRAASRVQ